MAARKPVAVYRAPGPSGVVVETDRFPVRIWRWPGWAMNDYHGQAPSILGDGELVKDDWKAVDDYYRRLLTGEVKRDAR